MARVWFILVLVAIAFWVFTIVDCAVQQPTRHRGVSKPVWILIVVLIPVLGGLLWLAVGRIRNSTIAARRAPDDDPEFLGSLGAVTDQDERIRRLEEELAQLDAEDDDPRWGTPGVPPVTDVAPPTGTAGPTSTTTPPSGTASPAGTTAPEPPARGLDGDDDGRGQRGAVG